MMPPCASLLYGLAALLFGPTRCAAYYLILEGPKSPVATGSDVTLRCKSSDGSIRDAYFYRNSTFLGTGLEWTINDIQPSHGGFYWCATTLFTMSSRTWLIIRDPDPASSPPPPSSPPAWPRLLCHLVVLCVYLIPTILMVSIYCDKRTGNKSAISMAMHTRDEGGQGRAEEHYYVIAGVTTEHD